MARHQARSPGIIARVQALGDGLGVIKARTRESLSARLYCRIYILGRSGFVADNAANEGNQRKTLHSAFLYNSPRAFAPTTISRSSIRATATGAWLSTCVEPLPKGASTVTTFDSTRNSPS
ncbi:protein of unknown function [Paraburkholderia kururiensis]